MGGETYNFAADFILKTCHHRHSNNHYCQSQAYTKNSNIKDGAGYALILVLAENQFFGDKAWEEEEFHFLAPP